MNKSTYYPVILKLLTKWEVVVLGPSYEGSKVFTILLCVASISILLIDRQVRQLHELQFVLWGQLWCHIPVIWRASRHTAMIVLGILSLELLSLKLSSNLISLGPACPLSAPMARFATDRVTSASLEFSLLPSPRCSLFHSPQESVSWIASMVKYSTINCGMMTKRSWGWHTNWTDETNTV